MDYVCNLQTVFNIKNEKNPQNICKNTSNTLNKSDKKRRLSGYTVMNKNIAISAHKCQFCGNKNIVTDPVTGEVVCEKCGFVTSEGDPNMGADRYSSASNSELGRVRTGAATTLMMHDQGLSTVIGKTNKDASGNPISTSIKNTVERLRTQDSRTQIHSSSDRNLKLALAEMGKLKDKLALSENVIEKAAWIYRKAMERKLVRGRSVSGLVAACLYAACRDAETPRTLKEVADGINVKKKDIAKCYRVIYRELELKVPVVDPVSVVSKIASEAGIGEKTKRKAIYILKKAKDQGGVAGKDPMGIAAAALYLACGMTGESVTQREVSDASRVTEVTIRNRTAGLKKMLRGTLF